MKNINDYKIKEELINEGLIDAIKRFFNWLFGAKKAKTDNDGEIISRFNKATTINDLKDAGVVFNKHIEKKFAELGNRINKLEKKDINNLNKDAEKIDYSNFDINNKSVENIIFAADVTNNINKVLNLTKSSDIKGFSNIYKIKKKLDESDDKNKLDIKYYAVFVTDSNIAFLCQVIKNYWDIKFSNINQYSGFAHIIYDTQKYFESGENQWLTYILDYIQNLKEFNDINGFTILTNSKSQNSDILQSKFNFNIDKEASKGENILLYKRIKNINANKKLKNNKVDYSKLELSNDEVLKQLELKESTDKNAEQYKSLNNTIEYNHPINSYYDIYYTPKNSTNKEIVCSILIEYEYWKKSKNKNEKYQNYANIKLQAFDKFNNGIAKWLEYFLMNINNIKTTINKTNEDGNKQEIQIEGLTINENNNDAINKILIDNSFILDKDNKIYFWKNPKYIENNNNNNNKFIEKNIKLEKITEQLRNILKHNNNDFKLIKSLRANRKVKDYDFYGIYNQKTKEDKNLIGIYLIENGYWENEINNNSDKYTEKTIDDITKFKDYMNLYIDIKSKYKDIKPDIIIDQIEKSVNNKDTKGIIISETNKLISEYLINNNFKELSIELKNNKNKILYIKSFTAALKNNVEDKKNEDSKKEIKKLNISINDIKKDNIDESFTLLNKIKNSEKIVNSDIHDYILTKDNKTLCAFLIEYGKWKHIYDKIEIIEEEKNKTKIKASKQDKEQIYNLKNYVNIYFEANNEFTENKKELFDTIINFIKKSTNEKWNGVSVLQSDNIKDILIDENFKSYKINLKIKKENIDKEEDTKILIYYKSFNDINFEDKNLNNKNKEKNESLSYIKKYTTSINEHLSIYDYYKYYKSINEELDENILWKLDKWFEMNEEQESEFIGILAAYKTNKNIKSLLKGTKLYDNIKEFVNFLNDDINSNNEIDYIYQVEKILSTVTNNKSNTNKYFII